MKHGILLLFLLTAGASFAQRGLDHYEYNVRCANFEPKYPSGLNNDQSPGRQDWGIHCSRSDSDVTFILDRLTWRDGNQVTNMYPVFGVPQYKTVRGRKVRAGGTNPQKASFPISVNEDKTCKMLPKDYAVIAMCRASCYTKTVQVLTPEGFTSAENFHQSEDMASLMAVAPGSQAGAITTVARKITAKVASLVAGEHDIFVITTETGKSIKVTGAHPLVTGSGHFIAGKSVKIGSSLMNEFGEAETVTSVEKTRYFGKVYNVSLKGRPGHYSDKVFVLEGLLSGDADIQNDDMTKMNRAMNKWFNTPEEI